MRNWCVSQCSVSRRLEQSTRCMGRGSPVLSKSAIPSMESESERASVPTPPGSRSGAFLSAALLWTRPSSRWRRLHCCRSPAPLDCSWLTFSHLIAGPTRSPLNALTAVAPPFLHFRLPLVLAPTCPLARAHLIIAACTACAATYSLLPFTL